LNLISCLTNTLIHKIIRKHTLTTDNYNFETIRLELKEWHSLPEESGISNNLAVIVKGILTPRVTESLPPTWQGDYTINRARDWINERNSEGVTLLILEKESQSPLGLVILFDMAIGQDLAELRLGYLLAEPAWGKGYGSELIQGLVDHCRNQKVASIVGGVAKDNMASIRILEKNGFVKDPETVGDEEFIFRLKLRSNNN